MAADVSALVSEHFLGMSEELGGDAAQGTFAPDKAECLQTHGEQKAWSSCFVPAREWQIREVLCLHFCSQNLGLYSPVGVCGWISPGIASYLGQEGRVPLHYRLEASVPAAPRPIHHWAPPLFNCCCGTGMPDFQLCLCVSLHGKSSGQKASNGW